MIFPFSYPAHRARFDRIKKVVFLLVAGLFLASCQNGMHDQPRYEPLEASEFFADGRSARPLVTGVVSRGPLEVAQITPTPRPTQVTGLDQFPFQLSTEILERGQEQYDVYCSPCHGYDGYGRGMIVQRGFSPPPSLHTGRLRQAPGSHYFDVITNGFGQMFPYAYRIEPDDRWAIVAYIRALQLSQNAGPEAVPADVLEQLRDASP